MTSRKLHGMAIIVAAVAAVSSVAANSGAAPTAISQESGKGSPLSWFGDSTGAGGWTYAYGGSTGIAVVGTDAKNQGKALKASFDDRDYSGVTVARGNGCDLTAQRVAGALRFRVRGEQGGERFYIGLLDDESERKDKKVQTKIASEDFFDVTVNWQRVEIALSEFPPTGEWWDAKGGALGIDAVDWSKMLEIRFSTDKEMNSLGCAADRKANVYFDDIEIIGNVSAPLKPRVARWWKRAEPVDPPLSLAGQSREGFFTWFSKKLPDIGSIYRYGGMADYRLIMPRAADTAGVFACYLDNGDYSGISLYRGNSGAIDIKPRRSEGGLEFWVKGGKGGEIFSIGLLDDESDAVNRKVQTKCDISKYTTVSRDWQLVKIPFRDFSDQGLWWDPDSRREKFGVVDWARISELRFACNKYENNERCGEGEPLRLYFANIRFVKSLENSFDKRAYWASFQSDEPDRVIDDFENPRRNGLWKPSCDSGSVIGASPERSKGPPEESTALAIDYRLREYGNVMFEFDRDTAASARDWSRHRALAMNAFSEEETQPVMVIIFDEGNEAWSAVFHVEKGWQDITVPFERFERFRWHQPAEASPNGRLDLGRVKAYEFQPTQILRRRSFLVDNVRLTNAGPKSGKRAVNSIRVNQAWYHPAGIKRFVVADSQASSFAVFDDKKSLVATGNLSGGRRYDASGEWVKTGDFTEVDKPGIYKIVVQENGDSQWVAIGREQCDTAFKAAMKSYYFQRASIDLSSDFAGPWGRKAGHPDTSCAFHASTGKAGTLRSPGGWYDAGDYGKYVVNAGITVGTLLSLHELLPALAGDGSLKIPESGNGKNDLLDEVKYELDWLKTMQDADGGVFFKIGGLSWDGIILPAECQQPRYVIGKSTASTLNFAAVMAQAARVYRTYDKKYASDCGKRAEAAWRWALKHPRVMDPAETGGTGSYGDSHFEDEFFWAACELLVSTGNKSYRKFVEGALPDNSVTGAAEWSMVRNLGLYSLSGGKNKLPEHTVNAIRGSIVAMADSLTAHIDATPYRIPVQDFRWGSSGAIANHAVLLCLAHRLSGASKYIDGIVETMDYLFGKNATGYCFVTGFGTLSPMHPHHRIMASDVVDRPFPGFLVGGPNAERQDEIKEGVFYPDKEPAKSYVDDVDAYAANETCINWNAPLVFALGYLNAHWSAAGK